MVVFRACDLNYFFEVIMPVNNANEAPSVKLSDVLKKAREKRGSLALDSVNRFLPQALGPINEISWTELPTLVANNLGPVFKNVIMPITLYSIINSIPLLPFRSAIALVLVAFFYCLGIADSRDEAEKIFSNAKKTLDSTQQTDTTVWTNQAEEETASTCQVTKDFVEKTFEDSELASETQRVVRLISCSNSVHVIYLDLAWRPYSQRGMHWSRCHSWSSNGAKARKTGRSRTFRINDFIVPLGFPPQLTARWESHFFISPAEKRYIHNTQ
jgi:hypothetical protein